MKKKRGKIAIVTSHEKKKEWGIRKSGHNKHVRIRHFLKAQFNFFILKRIVANSVTLADRK